MRVTPTATLAGYFLALSAGELHDQAGSEAGLTLPDEEVHEMEAELRWQHPTLSEAERHARACARVAYHYHRIHRQLLDDALRERAELPVMGAAPPAAPPWYLSPLVWWRVAVLLLMLLLWLCPRQAHAQLQSAQFQDAAGNTVANFRQNLVFQCSTNLTCTLVGGKVVVSAAGGGGGGGSVTSVSSGNLTPVFTVAVTNPTTTPAIAFTLSSAANHTFLGNHSGGLSPPAYIQPDYSDLTGTPQLAQSLANAAHKWLNSYSAVTGLFTQTQPDYADLTSLPQLAVTKAAVASNWLRSYDSTTGLFTASQPAYSDISGTVPAVTSVATTAPLGGGTITTTGTLTCTTCVTSVAPGAGIAHFAGGTQAVTSSPITSADTTGTFPATAHNLLSATHGDTTASAAVRGGGIFAVGASPLWTQVAHSAATGGYFKWNGTDIVASTLAAAGTGTPTACSNQFVTSLTLNADAAPTSVCSTVSYGQVSGTPTLRYQTVDNAATPLAQEPILNFTGAGVSCVDNAGATRTDCTVAGGGSGTVTSIATTSPISGGTITTTGTISCPNCVDKTLSNTYSAGTTQQMDTLLAKYWGGAPIFDATQYAGADPCAKIVAVYSDAAYIAAQRAIIDARGFIGAQNCASNPMTPTHSTKWLFGDVNLNLTSFFSFNGLAASDLIAAPSAPSLATSTSGGSLGATIGVGVKINYCNINTLGITGAGTLPSTEATITTGAGSTNSVTVTSPAAVMGAVGYNVFSATPVGSGWKLTNTTGCIPLATNYVIKTIGAGAVPPVTGTAYNGIYELEGAGDSTIISLNGASAGIFVGEPNVFLHNFSIVNSTGTNNTASIDIPDNFIGLLTVRDVSISGGGHGIYVGQNDSHVRLQNIRCGKFTVSGSCINVLGAAGNPATDVRISNVEMADSVWPAGGNLQGVVNLSFCNDCSVDTVYGRNLDFSNITNAGMVIVQNGSLRTNVHNINCDGLINADCVAVLTFSLDTNISDVQCSNTIVGTGAGIGANANNGDCLDLFSSGRTTVTNVTAQSLGLVGGLRFPCFEFFDDDEINATNINCYDSTGEGLRIFGSPRTLISNSHFNRNGKSGVSVEDSATVVTCNGTTTVAYVSGNAFGPWNPGTKVFIGAGPTQFSIASVTNNTTLVLTATCGLGASQAFFVPSTDWQLTNIQADANGTGTTGANAQSGISATGHSVGSVIGGSMNDDKAVQTQQWGISTAGGFSRVKVVNADFSGNLGASCTGIEYGAAVSGNHGMCDANSLSPVLFDDGATKTWQVAAQQSLYLDNKLGQASIVADTAGINTTETIIVKSAALPANRLIAGTVIRIPFIGTNTSSLANTSTFTLRMGTNGTTADAAIFTSVMAVSAITGTNVAFSGEVLCTVRTIGAAATGFCSVQLVNPNATSVATASTGISIIPLQLVLPSMSTFNTQTANNILSLTYKSAATTTTSIFKEAAIEIVYQ